MPGGEGIIVSYRLDVAVDHSQVFLEDCEREVNPEDLTNLYDEGAVARHLGASLKQVRVYTARSYGVIQVELIVRSDPPNDRLTEWDNVAEASLELTSGCLRVFGPESSSVGLEITLPPGTYRVRVYTAGVETVDEYRQDGEDHYRAIMWPARFADPMLLHSGVVRQW